MAAQSGVLILRNGQTIEGRICRVGDYYYVGMNDGEVRLRVAEVEVICHDLVDGYQRKRAQLPPENAAEHLRLAQWCQKVGLLDQAETELAAARKTDARHPMLELLEQRQRLLREPPPAPLKQAAGGDYEIGPEELDRMTQQLAPGVAEFFTQTIQPILVNNCMTSGCHARPERSEYYLLRPPHDQRPGRRLTQRNLYETLKWIDAKQPDQSPLMQAAANPHGGQKVAPLGPGRSQQWQLLQFFVEAAARGGQSPPTESGMQFEAAAARAGDRPVRPSLAQNPPMLPPSRFPEQEPLPLTEQQQAGFPISPMLGPVQPAIAFDGATPPAAVSPHGATATPGGATASRWAGSQEHVPPAAISEARRALSLRAGIGAASGEPSADEPRRLPIFDSNVRPAACEGPANASAKPGQPLRRPSAPAARSPSLGAQAGSAPSADPFDPEAFNQKHFPSNQSAASGTSAAPLIATDTGG